jgi:transcriptional regulator with GAF, ATPase, and Fis domain
MVRLQVRNIEKALSRCKGKIYGPDGAAALLGLKPTTLATRIKKMNIQRLS